MPEGLFFCIIELGHFLGSNVVKVSGNLIAKWKFSRQSEREREQTSKKSQYKRFSVPVEGDASPIPNHNIFQLNMFNEVQRIYHRSHFTCFFPPLISFMYFLWFKFQFRHLLWWNFRMERNAKYCVVWLRSLSWFLTATSTWNMQNIILSIKKSN